MLECLWQAFIWKPVLPALMRVEREGENGINWEKDWDREMEGRRAREKGKEKEKEGEIWLHIHLTLLHLLITLQRGVWNLNTFAHWHTRLWPFLRADTQEENPLTLPGLLQILAGLSCKAGRHTETAGFNTVTLVCTLSSLPEANALLLDLLVSSYHTHYYTLLPQPFKYFLNNGNSPY